MTAWYWLAFVVACVVVLYAIPWAFDLIEQHAEEQDRRTWREMGGGRW